MPSEVLLQLPELTFTNKPTLELEVSSYKDIAIKLLASIANSDGILFLDEYNTYIRSASAILGKSELEDVTARLRVLHAFLNPEDDPKSLIKELSKAIGEKQVSLNAREAIVHHFLALLESAPQDDETGIGLIQNLIQALLPHHTGKYTVRLDAVREKTRELISEEKRQPTTLVESFLGFFRFKKKSRSQKNTPKIDVYAARINAQAESCAKSILLLGKRIASLPLIEKAEGLLESLEPQPYRIAIVGEFKHGKSTLFNTIVGQKLSPIGESVATTSAVIELYYSEEPQYQGIWLDDSSLTKIREYVKKHKDDFRIARYGEQLEQLTQEEEFQAGGAIELQAQDEIEKYASADGPYSIGMSKIRAGLPMPDLKSGVVIVDTPGINDPMHVRDFISLEESKKANCVLFVMRADKLGTESERRFLRMLYESGRLATLFLVITHTDHLSEDAVAQVGNHAQHWLQGVFSGEDSPSFKGVFPVHAKDAMEQYASESGESEDDQTGFQELWNALVTVANSKKRSEEYAQDIQRQQRNLVNLAQHEKDEFLRRYLQELPGEDQIKMAASISDKFVMLATSYQEQIQNRLLSISQRLESSAQEFENKFSETLTHINKEVQSKIAGQVKNLGDDYSDKKKWEAFESDHLPMLLHENIESFFQMCEEELHTWGNELQLFSQELEQTSTSGLEGLKSARHELLKLSSIKTGITTLSCHADRLVSRAETFIRRSKDGAMGFTLGNPRQAISFLGIVPQIAILGSGLTLGVIGAAIGTLAIWKSISNPEHRKEKFIESNTEKIMDKLKKQDFWQTLKVQYLRELENVGSLFTELATQKYQPLIEEALASKQEAKLQQNLGQRLRKDANRYVDHLLKDTISELP